MFKYLLYLIYTITVMPMLLISIMVISKENRHPIILLFLLIIYTLTATLFLSKLLTSYYFSYLMFLVTIGGVMIIFMYMVSLTNKNSDMKKMKYKKIIIMISIYFVIFYIFMNSIYMDCSMLFVYKIPGMMSIKFINDTYMSMNIMYLNNNKMTSLCIMLLLMMLISVVKMCSKHYGPLRQMKK